MYVAQDAAFLLQTCRARLERLRDEGFAVCVATPHTAALDEFAALGFEIRPLPGIDRWNVLGRLAAAPILQAHFLEQRPLLVHGFGQPWAWLAAFTAHHAQVPAVFATIDAHDFSTPLRVAAYRKLASWTDRYIVHHEQDLEGLLAREIAAPRQVELLLGGYGVDLKQFLPDDEDLVPEARPARARTVLLAREAEDLRAVERAIARRHPEVGWLRHREPVSAELLAAADLYVTVDPNEAEGLSMMAAAAMRVPVVAVRSAAARAVVVDYETGRLAPDPGSLIDVLCEVIEDPKRLTDMGIRAAARAQQRFDRQQIDAQLLNVYDLALQPRRA